MSLSGKLASQLRALVTLLLSCTVHISLMLHITLTDATTVYIICISHLASEMVTCSSYAHLILDVAMLIIDS